MSAAAPGTLETRRCANHPSRPGAATCMRCRKIVCTECSTRWEGINYCVPCLSARRAAAEERSSATGVLAWLVVTAGTLFAAVHLIAWVGILLADR